MAKKPIGIKILGWIITVLAINEFISYIIFMTVLYSPRGLFPSFLNYYVGIVPYFMYLYFPDNFFSLTKISVALPLVYSVLFLVSAIGLIRLKNWAKVLTIFCLCFLLLSISISFYNSLKEIIRYSKVLLSFLYFFKTLILLYPIIYLTRPKVREQFK